MSLLRLTGIEEKALALCQAEQSIYLPNISPASESIDYIFITMEPSLKWHQDLHSKGLDPLAMGLHNFSFSIEDFILHYCIRKFLCQSEKKEGITYYLTDLAKGALKIQEAGKNRNLRYAKWFPLLIGELKSISCMGTQFIAVGKTVYDFLRENQFLKYVSLPNYQLTLFSILHYSRTASRYRVKCEDTPGNNHIYDVKKISHKDNCEQAGICSITIRDIIETAWNVLIDSGIKKVLALKIINRINKPLTANDNNLIHTYYIQFMHSDVNGNKIL